MNGKHVVVVGGGAIGTAAAYYLAQTDWQVTLLDKDRQGAGATGGNCGLLAYSHVLPLNEPGAVRKTLKMLCRGNSPLTIRPRWDFALAMWLLRFARRCKPQAMLESAAALAGLLASAARLNRELVEHESIDCEWEDRGCLFVYQHREGMEHYAATDRLLRERYGVPATRYEGPALTALEPALRPGAAAGGWHYEQDAHLNPEKFLLELRRALERRGVVIREQCEATGFVPSHGRAAVVETTAGPIAADAFVVATGAWTPQLRRALGCRVPIQPGKGYTLTMPRPPRCPSIPLIFQEQKVVVTPLPSAYRLGSTMEFAGYDTSLPPKRLALFTRAAEHYLHDPYTEPITDRWYGWRPMTYDGKPYIDRAPRLANVVIAAGHNMLGLTLASVTGKLVAEMLGGLPPHLPLEPFALRRS